MLDQTDVVGALSKFLPKGALGKVRSTPNKGTPVAISGRGLSQKSTSIEANDNYSELSAVALHPSWHTPTRAGASARIPGRNLPSVPPSRRRYLVSEHAH